MKLKRIFAIFLAGLAVLALAGCGKTASSDTADAKKDYAQIIHDARSDDDNEAYLIFSQGEDGKFTAKYGASAEYEADQLNDEVKNMLLPMLNLDDGSYTELSASVSAMMVRSYGVAIVKPAEGKTDEVKQALEAFVTGQQQSMQNYLEDQYQIAKAAKVEVVPTGEVVLVCSENSDKVLESIEKALAK